MGEGLSGWRNRLALWRAARAPVASGFARLPEPRSIGLYARGKQMVAGNFTSGAASVEAPGRAIWDVPFADPMARVEIHGFQWLDDLAAFGDMRAQERAQAWTFDWIARFGRGQGPGWAPDLIGRRLTRWVMQAGMLTEGRDAAPLLQSLSLQLHFLGGQAKSFEALSGLIIAALAVDMEALVSPALRSLAALCEAEIDMGGGITSRNPEELLEIFTLLTWVSLSLGEAEAALPPEVSGAMERIAPTLRALRHADGGLARFHDGGRGAEGRLDAALANAGVRPMANAGMAMGFVRLHGGRTTVILDAAPPPPGDHGHASTCGFEMTSGRRPVVVNVGAGTVFGPEWRQAGRATASHATLAVEGYSSSRLGASGQGDFNERAEVTTLRVLPGENGAGVHLVHNGWAVTHGLSHIRDLMLTNDGRHLQGVDRLAAITTADKRRFERLAQGRRFQGVKFAIRFHLHPDVEARVDLGGSAISLTLRSGEIWVFRHDGAAKMTLEPSIYLEKTKARPRESLQIVLSGAALDFDTQAGWTLAKAQDTPLAIRDLERDDPAGQI
ncbi:heparinase II/III family protein [Stagnihabitans tardus]|uniref:Heparinase n=1 Tax=Stagnihabitans tardus TaxID=2699202 RepID=A0AAE4YH09_9RHOB|nr:heparinase II/III family protein [Stagnihabitans tardus]NBZ89610.1 heparinase [Stagnihabitans tardus]